MISIRPLSVLVALALCPACSSTRETTEDDGPARGDPERSSRDGSASKSPEKAPAKAPVAGANYQITTVPQGPFKVGAEARVDVRLTGRNGYHVNQEYPIQLRVEPVDGVRLAKTKLVRADASAFEEAQAVLPIALTPETAGRKAVRATLNFSVCNPQNCLLERQPVTAEFEAQP